MLASVMSVDAALFHRDLVPAGLLRLVSDERLVESVRAGSERAFEALFHRHRQPVLAFCRHMLGSAADAEDAVQHTFLAAYRDLMRSEKPIALRPWLYAIARHRCLSLLRARRERPSAELPDSGVDNLAAVVDAREDVRATFTDLARLPDDQRAALILAELEDVPHEEIARILGCRRDKVKALVFQARASLAADRAARETPCADIRAQLATVGGALRHTNLRRHVRECPGCHAFRRELRAGRRGFGILLPFAGIKRAVLSVVSGTGGAGAGGAALTAGALGGGGLAGTALVVVAVAAGGGPPEPSAEADARPTSAAADLRPAERARLQFAARPEATAVFRARDGLGAVGDVYGAEELEAALPHEAAGRLAPADVEPGAEHSAADGPATDAGGDARSGAPEATERRGGEGADGGSPGAPPTPPGQPRSRVPSKPADAPAGHRGWAPARPIDPRSGQAKPRDEPVEPGNGTSPARPRSEPRQTENAGGSANPARPGDPGGPAKAGEPGGQAKPLESAQAPKDTGMAGQDTPSGGPSPAAGSPQAHAGQPVSSGPPPSDDGGGTGSGHDGGGNGHVHV
jgi:RNA polymerase sigma factor (sigma-70 family)